MPAAEGQEVDFLRSTKVVEAVGLFSDKSDDAYRKAADAVRAGTATKDQRDLNDKAAKQAGSFGQRARNAMK